VAAVLTGVVGRVKWAYYDAALIEGYAVARTAEEWSLRATVVMSDAFKMAQQPLVFVAPHQHGQWRFPILSHELTSGTLTARLGPPED
jgi:hypothetical protein